MDNKVELHKKLCMELNDLYARKNADYGDSFHKSYIEEGLAMPRIRLGDKYNRFKHLTLSDKILVTDEGIRDTLIDLANYALMTVLELDIERQKKTEPEQESNEESEEDYEWDWIEMKSKRDGTRYYKCPICGFMVKEKSKSCPCCSFLSLLS